MSEQTVASGTLFNIFQQPRSSPLFRTAIAVPAGESSCNAHLHPCRVVIIVVVAAAATYVFQIWREDNGKSIRVGYTVRVTFYTYVPFCCLFMQSVRDWTTRVRRAFRSVSKNCIRRLVVGGGQARACSRAQIYCETGK